LARVDSDFAGSKSAVDRYKNSKAAGTSKTVRAHARICRKRANDVQEIDRPMSLSILRRWTIAMAGIGLLGLAGTARGDDHAKKASSPPLAVATPELTPSTSPADPLAAQVEEAIHVTARRFLDTDVHTPWQIIHGLLAYRRDYRLKQHGLKVNALEWIASGPTYQGQPWFEKTAYGGHAHPYNGVPYAFQGHPCQFLACMTMCDLPLDFKFAAAGGETVTVTDLIHGAQMEVNDREEVTWVLWFLAHYLDSDAQWTNKDGEPWSMERLVQVETGKTVTASACGGAHGLFALAYARNGLRAAGHSLYGPWLEADQKIRRYVEEARMNQNPDGTFSSNYFRGPGHSDEFEKRLGTTGHILEFLCAALPQSQLTEEWPRRAVAALANDLIENRLAPCECGSLYHAVDGLTIYRSRVWPELDPARRTVTTAKPVAAAVPVGPGSITNAAANSPPSPEAPIEKPSRERGAVESP
jgi:hypothetical protein